MTYHDLPTLDKVVLEALNLLTKNKPQSLPLKNLSFPIVVGSGNAYNTAQVIFSNKKSIIANESNFSRIITTYKPLIKNKTIKEAVIISASGEKDSIWEIKLAKKNNLHTILLTWSPDSSATKLADQVFLYPKIAEPYTYNVSTYLGMMLSISKESPEKIKKFIQSLKLPNLKKYQAYSFILPDEFTSIASMLEIKRDELFGPFLSLRAFSFGQARHARFVHPSNQELVISLEKNLFFGKPKHRFEINTPANSGPALIMALTYYLIGQIQKVKPPYFKENIAKFCQTGPKAYGSEKPFPIIVE